MISVISELISSVYIQGRNNVTAARELDPDNARVKLSENTNKPLNPNETVKWDVINKHQPALGVQPSSKLHTLSGEIVIFQS